MKSERVHDETQWRRIRIEPVALVLLHEERRKKHKHTHIYQKYTCTHMQKIKWNKSFALTIKMEVYM